MDWFRARHARSSQRLASASWKQCAMSDRLTRPLRTVSGRWEGRSLSTQHNKQLAYVPPTWVKYCSLSSRQGSGTGGEGQSAPMAAMQHALQVAALEACLCLLCRPTLQGPCNAAHLNTSRMHCKGKGGNKTANCDRRSGMAPSQHRMAMLSSIDKRRFYKRCGKVALTVPTHDASTSPFSPAPPAWSAQVQASSSTA